MYPPEGSVSVQPDQGVAGTYGTWSVTYRVGKRGIKRYGGIRVQLPDSWHAGIRNSANRLQASNPELDNHVAAACSQAAVKLRTWVEHEPGREVVLVKEYRGGLDGRQTRYIYVVRVWVLDADLPEGSSLSVIYGDTSHGSRGMLAGAISTRPEGVSIAIDNEGTGAFRLHPDHPALTICAGPAVELMSVGPSVLVQGEPAELLLSVVDSNQNPADAFDGEVSLRVTHGEADVPSKIRFASKRGWEEARIIPRTTGILRIEALGESGRLYANTNPMKVFDRPPKLKTYWGDLHSHTHYSFDGVGHGNFEYARYTSGLDFYAMTDHSSPEGLGPNTPDVWAEYTALVDKYYDPGKFVTLHAYECSLGAPYGHHNVFFRGKPTGLPLPEEVGLAQVWQSLRIGEALTIPHHTGKMPEPIFWYPHDSELDRNIEIYSAHGLSEAYNPWHPLAFEQSMFTEPSKSVRGPQYAQDAWLEGLQLSTIASSDDHRGHPGQSQYGLAAVSATGLTREEIFDALYARRTYGTTGVKILLDFSINGQSMGGQLRVTGSPQLEIEAHGSEAIELVEVLRYCRSDGAFKVIFTLHPADPDFSWSQMDHTFVEDSIYYMRLRQTGLVRNRIVMAWSSPIWVKRA
jgi:hypothetical protein